MELRPQLRSQMEFGNEANTSHSSRTPPASGLREAHLAPHHPPMPRFYIPPARWNLDRLLLDEDETHHATDVLRMKAGDRATVFNGEGAQAAVEHLVLLDKAQQ